MELVERDAALVARREAARREREEAVARESARVIREGMEAMCEQTRRAVAALAQQLDAERSTVAAQKTTIAVCFLNLLLINIFILTYFLPVN